MLPPHLQDLLKESNVELPDAPQTLLLVDDEPENLEVLTALLGDIWKVETATNGLHALEKIGAGLNVDLVIADQRMAGMSGVDLLSILAKDHPSITRVVLTGHSDVGPMLDAVNRAAAWRFLLKPYEPEELRATVEEGLRLKRNRALLQTLIGAMTQRRNALAATLDELQSAQAQLFAVERLSTVGSAAAGIVHNLRNLSTIMSMLMAEFSRREPPPSVRAATETAQTEMNSLVQLLENLRQLARAQDAQPTVTEVRLQPFLLSTLELAALQHAGRPMRVDAVGGPRTAKLDSRRIQQALLALIDNAVRASHPDAEVTLGARIELRPQSVGSHVAVEWLVLEVTDRGSGTSREAVQALQQPFAGDPKGAYAGLGIEIAHLVARAHQGILEVASEARRGTSARILIPTGVHYAESGIRA